MEVSNETNYNGIINQAFELIKKRIVIILIVGIIAGIGGWYYKGLMPTKYSAKSIFYPDKEATLSGSPLELINGTTSAKGGALAILSKVLASRSMTVFIAQRKVDPKLGKKYKTLADWIVDDNNNKLMPWQKKSDFTKMPDGQKLQIASNVLRNGCFAVIDESGFMSLINNAYSEELALYENESIIDELITFNYNKKTEKAKNDLEYINHRADSMKELYENLKYDYARFDDANKFIIKQTVGIPKLDLDERKKIIAQRYFKLVDMQEQAFIRYQTDKPIVEILDYPYIEGVAKPSQMVSALMYAVFTILISMIFVVRNLIFGLIKDEITKATSKNKNQSTASETMPDSVL
jgi:hypothetical protein